MLGEYSNIQDFDLKAIPEWAVMNYKDLFCNSQASKVVLLCRIPNISERKLRFDELTHHLSQKRDTLEVNSSARFGQSRNRGCGFIGEGV